MKIVLATHNQHKLKEIKQLIPPSIELLSLHDIGWDQEIAETGETFIQNAEIKAKTVFEKTKYIVLADDSGIEVDVLDGRPGVFSARYAGIPKSDVANNLLLLKEMQGKENRRANFYAVLCLYLSESKKLFFEGRVYGTIVHQLQGTGGFGYDPLFIPDGYQNTFSELPVSVKNQISHRAKAMSKFLEFIENHEV